MRSFGPLPTQDNGGADFSLVVVRQSPNNAYPQCVHHGAMNKVSREGWWRCIATSGPRHNACRAACAEVGR